MYRNEMPLRKIVTTITAGVIGLIILITLVSFFTRVDPGHVGVKINSLGSHKGVEQGDLGVGWYWAGPGTTIVEYPTFQQTYTFTWDKHEGKQIDEHMECSSAEGQVAKANVSVNWQLVPGKAFVAYQTFRAGTDEITHSVLRSRIRDALSRACRAFTVEQLYGAEGARVIDLAKKFVNEGIPADTKMGTEAVPGMRQFGVDVLALSLIGRFHFDQAIEQQIANKVNAIQVAETKENELRQVKADQAKQIAEAEGQAKKQIAAAEGQAKATLLAAEAQAEANRKLAASISAPILDMKRLDIQLEQVRKWGGGVPQIITSDKGSGQILDLRSK